MHVVLDVRLNRICWRGKKYDNKFSCQNRYALTCGCEIEWDLLVGEETLDICQTAASLGEWLSPPR